MNNLDIVLALFTTPNHRFSRVDATAAFQATTSATRGVTTGGVWGGVSPPPNLSKRYSRRAKTKKRSGKTTENLVESYG